MAEATTGDKDRRKDLRRWSLNEQGETSGLMPGASCYPISSATATSVAPRWSQNTWRFSEWVNVFSDEMSRGHHIPHPQGHIASQPLRESRYVKLGEPWVGSAAVVPHPITSLRLERPEVAIILIAADTMRSKIAPPRWLEAYMR